MTIISAAIILSVTVMEFVDYRHVGIHTAVIVNRSRGEKVTVGMNGNVPKSAMLL